MATNFESAFASLFGNKNEETTVSNDNNKRPTSTMWLNIGKTFTFTNEKGEQEELFVSLPFGLAIDTMQPMKGNSRLAMYKNALLKELQNLFTKMEPNASVTVPQGGLEIQMLRTSNEPRQAQNNTEEEIMNQIKLNFG